MGKLLKRQSEQLSLYVQQIAWLNTAPEPPKRKGAKPEKQPTRLHRMKADKLTPSLPDNPAPYITDWLMEIGPLASTGMGPAPLGWAEIRAWQDSVGIELDPWEARTIRQLSKEFLTTMHEAKDPTFPAPFQSAQDIERNRGAVDRQLRNTFAAIRMSRGKP